MENELEKAADDYANRVIEHDIDSTRYAMKNPFGAARADFLAGAKHERERILAIVGEIWDRLTPAQSIAGDWAATTAQEIHERITNQPMIIRGEHG